ncbi:MAG: efflux RND transporter periplasmic adaptor subunit [Bacteroidota bacterium]
MSRFIGFLLLILLLTSCQEEVKTSDAYGNFEATNVLVSSEANGKLLFLNVEEGRKLNEESLVGLVDTTQLHLQKKQIEATIGILPQKLLTSLAEIEVLERQKENLTRERDRVARLIEKKAATSKQLDDLNGEIEVIDKQIVAVRTQTNTSNRSILVEKEPLLAQIDLLNDQIRKSYIYNPISGTVLTKLSEPSEIVGMGTPLYRIAKLDTITLRFYVSGTQLKSIDYGQVIEVLIDEGQDGFESFKGKISWIADQAEFTPKTIQTKEERVNLVYAVEAKVPNPDGKLKIGMPAEVNFNYSPSQNISSNESNRTSAPQ